MLSLCLARAHNVIAICLSPHSETRAPGCGGEACTSVHVIFILSDFNITSFSLEFGFPAIRYFPPSPPFIIPSFTVF
jgi:hypothetical protein